MNATNQSREDHKRFHRLEKIMYKCADELEKKNDVPISDLIRIVTIIYDFVEGIHHKREETVYFPCIVSHDSALKKETDKFTLEHQFGRNTIWKLSLYIANWAEGGEKNRIKAVQFLRAYAQHITPHLKQEEVFLDSVEGKIIPKEEDEKMFKEYKSDFPTSNREEKVLAELALLETRSWFLN